ncbi:MAG: DUF4345 family protein, partial [Gammaproteobacteria bacterium]
VAALNATGTVDIRAAHCYLEPAIGGTVDIRATYGGFQIAVGALMLGGALRPVLTQPMLLVYGVVCACVGSTRLLGALLASEWSGYTLIGVSFELGCVAAVLFLLRGARAGS